MKYYKDVDDEIWTWDEHETMKCYYANGYGIENKEWVLMAATKPETITDLVEITEAEAFMEMI